MNSAPTLLAVFAHPDDESLVAGGTLAKYADDGWRVILVCATRGEWGPISDEALADYENLGNVREAELRAACEVLGISEVQFLNLPDGSVRWALEEDETIFINFVEKIYDWQPQIIITHDAQGLYGHDDHIAIFEFVTKAVRENSSTEIWCATYPPGLINEVTSALMEANLPQSFWDISPEQFGVPREAITKEIDVSEYCKHKLEALHCHRTQMLPEHALTAIPAEIFARYFGREFFVVQG